MTVEQAIQQRYSCRDFQARDVDNDTLKRIIDLARNAPSASNRQEWRFVAIKDKGRIKAVTEKAGDQGWWAKAPVIVACCADTNNHVMKCRQACYPIDLAIIIDHITLIATDLGLATCWIGAFDEDAVKEICGIPRHIRVVELLIMGYPADTSKPKKRLGVPDILYKDAWGSNF